MKADLDLVYQRLEEAGVDMIEGPSLTAFAVSGGAVALVGAHGDTGWCWCQPEVEKMPCGHWHTVHRRLMDCDDEGFDELYGTVWFHTHEWTIPTDQERDLASGIVLVV